MIIKNLNVKAKDKHILKDLNLSIEGTEVIMGKNGSGKSTLMKAIMGDPSYTLEGEIIIDNENILNLETNERANKYRIFLSFQSPPMLEGITLDQLIKRIYYKAKGYDDRDLSKIKEFREYINDWIEMLGIDNEFLKREINKDLSGGEKKKSEILQMIAFQPKYILLDEIDSGLDVDSLRRISEVINKYVSKTGAKVLLITHYNRILRYIKPDRVHIMKEGRIVKSGGVELIDLVESKGYDIF
jgi:Fe-S cluster assembly ATP-binding protein